MTAASPVRFSPSSPIKPIVTFRSIASSSNSTRAPSSRRHKPPPAVVRKLPSPIAVRDKKALAVELDEWEKWELVSRQQAFARARARSSALDRQLQSPARQQRDPTADIDDELRAINALLERVELDRSRETEQAQKQFQDRNEALWRTIDQAIKAAESAQAQAAAQQRAAAEQKQREEQAEAKRRQEAQAAAKAKADAEARDKAEAEKRSREEAEARKKAEAEAAKKAQADAQAAKASQDASSSLMSGLATKETEWREWRDRMLKVKNDVIAVVKADPVIKKEVRQNIRTIGVKVGQVVNTRESIIKITEELHEQLSRYAPFIPSASQPVVKSSQPSKQYLYTLSHLSKCLIRQTENEVSANAQAAFPLAKVVVGLLLRGHRMLGGVLMARLVKKCCWVIPYYPAKEASQTDVEYRKSVGQKEGSGESDVQYASRMSAILTLYLAICTVDLSLLLPHPLPNLEALIPPNFRITAVWSWLAAIVRKPLAGLDPTPQFIYTALETVGDDLVRTYGLAQMAKFATAIRTQGLGLANTTDPVVAGAGSLGPNNSPARQRLALALQQLEGGTLASSPAKVWET